jgi:RimJ/RimL family protein N-acetyltransferase
MLLTYAFAERSPHHSARSSAVVARLGMTLDGVLREAWFSGGVLHYKQMERAGFVANAFASD